MKFAFHVMVLSTLLPCSALFADEEVSISAAKVDDNGFLVHDVRSPYQTKTTLIRILLPDRKHKENKHPVVYVLPVEAGTEQVLKFRIRVNG